MNAFENYGRFKSKVSVRLSLLGLLVLLGTILFHFRPVLAATLGLSVEVVQDGGLSGALNTVGDVVNGVIVCPSAPTSGCDFSENDGVVRTHDRVAYRFNYNVNPTIDPNEDIIVTSTLDEGITWGFLPGSCTGAGSGISSDGRTLTCNLGKFASATSASFDALVDVGGLPNGTIIDFDAAIDGAASTATEANAPDVTVTAAPRFDIQKSGGGTSGATVDGVEGFLISYTLDLWTLNETSDFDPLLGSEALVDSFTLVDDISSVSPNALLIECLPHNSPLSPQANSNSRPYGKVGMTASATEINSVVDEGGISCSQSGAGANFDISLSGVDTTLNNVPTENRNGTSIAASQRFAGSYLVRIFVPQQDVVDAGGELDVTNCFSAFDPISVTGQSNFLGNSEDTSNNCNTRTLTVGASGGWGKVYTDGLGSTGLAGTTTSRKSGDGLVVPGETWGIRLNHGNSGLVDINDVVICDIIDNSRYVLTGNTQIGGSYNGASVIEYATSYVGSWPPDPQTASPADVNSECTATSVVWVESASYGGDMADVTKWRLRVTEALPPGKSITAWVEATALDLDPSSGGKIPNGTVLPNYASRQATELDNGNYSNCKYRPGLYPTPSHQSTGCGDRLALARGIVRIAKDVSVDAVNAGNVVIWMLHPTFTSNGNDITENVTVVDVLPPALRLVAGSATVEPNQAIMCTGPGTPHPECTENGATVLIWNLGALPANTVIPQITFKTLVDGTTPNNIRLDNRTIITSPADPSPEGDRDADASVLVQVSASVLPFKSVQTPSRLPDETLQFTLSLINNTDAPLTGLDLIDVLPFNGDGSVGPFGASEPYSDGRTPPSSYTGTLDFTSMTLPAGATVYFSKDGAGTIDRSPVHLINGSPNSNDLAIGTTRWCLGTDGSSVNPSAVPTVGGSVSDCPNTNGEVTAYRIIWPGPLAANGGTQNFVLLLGTGGNARPDIYTNNFGVNAAELPLPALSNDVSARVVEPSIGDRVWLDTNRNGVQEGTEQGVGGVKVKLIGTDIFGRLVEMEATTDPDGYYLFSFADGLFPSNGDGYVVTIDPATFPEPYVQTYDLDDGTGPFNTPMSSGPVVVNAGDSRRDVDFGLVSEELPVTIGYVHILRQGEQIVLTWQTATEAGTAGFNILAEHADGLQQVNADLIPSTVIDSVSPTDYSVSLRSAATTFYLQEVSIYGAVDQLGPFEVGESYGVYTGVDQVAPDSPSVSVFLPLIQ